MSEVTLLDPAMLSIIATFVLGLFGSLGKLVQIRTKLQALSKVVTEIDLALADGKITEAETKTIMALFRGLVK